MYLVYKVSALIDSDLVVHVLRYLANIPMLEAAGAAMKLIVFAIVMRGYRWASTRSQRLRKLPAREWRPEWR